MTADTPPQQKEEANGRSGPAHRCPPCGWSFGKASETQTKHSHLHRHRCPGASSATPLDVMAPGAQPLRPRQGWHDDLTSALFGM